ncbi:MAG TPA: ATP phosphoribosyltransferase [Longimicrobiaceae bacterium]
MSAVPLRVALPKGRLMPQVLKLWAQLGCEVPEEALGSRRLILPCENGRFEFLPVKNRDVPTYVEAGVADLGVVGLDVLREQRPDVLQPLDLGLGACRMAVAAPRGTPYPRLPGAVTPRVATKYIATARQFFAEAGVQVELVRITGSVELAPLLGLSHWIVDLVETGRTLEENGLVVLDTIFASSARLIVNRASHKLRLEEHQRLIGELEEVLRGARK